MARSMLLRVCSLPPQTEKRCRGPRVLHGTSTKENTCLTLRYTPFASRLPAGPVSGTCSRPAAFVNNRKKTSLHESILSGIKARFGALARYAAALDEKSGARLSAADHPQQAAKQLETLLRLPETGTLLHFEAGTAVFWKPFTPRGPAGNFRPSNPATRSCGCSKAFLRSAYNADYRDADIVSRFDIIAVTKPLDEVEKPLNAVRWLSRRLADNGTLFLWQPALRMGTGLSLHGLPIRIANLTALCKTAGLSVDTITTEGEVVCLCARNTPQR